MRHARVMFVCVLGVATAILAPTDAGAQRPDCEAYPPVNCADFAATDIITDEPWEVEDENETIVRVENHGDLDALGMVRMRARARVRRGVAKVEPRRMNIFLASGDSALVMFDVTPRAEGTYETTACGTARRPGERHRPDDCVTAFIDAEDNI